MKLPAIPKFSALSTRERLLTAGVVFVMCVLLLDRVVLGPWWRHIHDVNQEIHRLTKSIRTYEQLLERKPQLLAEVEAYSAYLRQLEAGQGDVAALLREIETIGKESGISLGEVKPVTGSSESLQEYFFEIHFNGSLKQWIHFVYLLQTSKTLFQIDRAALGAAEGNPGMLDGSLRVVHKVMKMPLA